MISLPDAVHVGFSKCASTFLRSFFREHPAVFLVSEAHFFVPFERSAYDSGKEFYCPLFRDAAPGQLKVESDEHIVLPLLHPVLRAAATTLESVAEASSRVKSIQPDAKIILVIRNQVDLILSRYGEYIVGGRNCDFDVFVDEFLGSRKDGINYFQNYYSKIIEIFYNDFSAGNVLVILQEELFKDQSNVVAQLCRFLGVDAIPTQNQPSGYPARLLTLSRFRAVARSGKGSKNTGLSYLGLKIMRFWNKMTVLEPEEAYYKKAVARIPYFLYKAGVRAIRLADYYFPRRLKGDKKELLTPRIVKRIRDEFREDNMRLAELLSKDLASLGY